MKLEKILKLTLTEEEIGHIQRTAEIFNDICNAYYNENMCYDCCPLSDLCPCSSTVPNTLYSLIKQLDATKGA